MLTSAGRAVHYATIRIHRRFNELAVLAAESDVDDTERWVTIARDAATGHMFTTGRFKMGARDTPHIYPHSSVGVVVRNNISGRSSKASEFRFSNLRLCSE